VQGFILVHRSMLEWEWYDDPNAMRLFFHCLLKANHKNKPWKSILIKRGQFITSVKHLENELCLSRSQVRLAIKKLKSTNEITTKTTKQYTAITVVNYDKYQSRDQQNNQRTTNEQPTDNQRTTTTKQCNNVNNTNSPSSDVSEKAPRKKSSSKNYKYTDQEIQ